MVATPRDYGESTRVGAPYKPATWAADIAAVATHIGFERFLVFGYSFTGAFGPWLALQLSQYESVAAVASGGFPLLGDYGVTARDVEAQLESLRPDEKLWVEYSRRFDLEAGAAFYRDLARLAPNALVDQLPCPLYSFWGDRDSEAVGMVMTNEELADGLSARGVRWKQYAGYDHEGLNSELTVAWPDAERWLLEQAALV